MTKITYKGHEYDADVAAMLMDNEIRETLHDRRHWKSEQYFFDAYCAAHKAKFGTEFIIN